MAAASPRLRFAPSPTGYLHVGGARTVLFNWLVARREGGDMVLRIEDTDTERNRPELTDDILEQIRWLGLAWDGDPVHQSDRLHLYTKAADELFAAGRAYWCDCTAEQVQQRARDRGGPPGYDGFCRDRGLGPGGGAALRFRVPDAGSTTFHDLVRGRVTFENAKLEDFVLLRSNGIPTFLLANVVDDADLGITHVVRGEEHVNGTPKYLLIADTLGLDHHPVFAHLPVLVNEQRKKLSKRRDSVSVAEFRAAGYLPEAMVNYLATLGWGAPDGVEIRPLAEIVDLFRLEDVTQSPAFFDTRKLQHFNAEYIRALDPDAFVERARPYFAHGEATEAVLRPLAEFVRDRVRLLTEVEPMVDFLREDTVTFDEASWQKHVAKHGDRAGAMLDAAIDRLAECEWEAPAIEAALLDAAAAAGFVNAEGNPQFAKAQGPVRVAVTGRGVGPPLYESLAVLGRGRTLDRLRAARAAL
jgi:glutamyl-tRNA synthetase